MLRINKSDGRRIAIVNVSRGENACGLAVRPVSNYSPDLYIGNITLMTDAAAA